MIKLIYDFLVKNKVSCDYDLLNKRISSHPFYPSLNSVTDTFEELNIEYSAFISDKKQLDLLRLPLLIFVNNNSSNDFVLVENINQLMTNNSLFENWNGVALMINEKKAKIQKFNLKETIYNLLFVNSRYVFAFLFFTIFIYFFYIYNISIEFVLFLILNFVAIYICWQIINFNLGRNSFVIKQLCGLDNSNSCSKVLNSNIGKINKNFGLGEIGLSYYIFIGIYIILSLVFKYDFYILYILSFLSVISTLFSIYIQLFVLKTTCKLCIIIILVNWIQFSLLQINRIEIINFKNINIPSLSILLSLFFIILISILCTYFIKSYLTNVSKINHLEIEKLKWERNPFIFINQLHNQKHINDEIWNDDLLLGNKDSLIRVIVIINPFCVPCSESFKHITELVDLHNNSICIIIRIMSNSNDINDKRRVAFNCLLKAIEMGYSLRDVLYSWFKYLDLDKFKKAYGLEEELKDFTDCISKHDNWGRSIGIKYTPTYFLNGFEIVNPYDLASLKIHLNYYLEHITLTKVVRNT